MRKEVPNLTVEARVYIEDLVQSNTWLLLASSPGMPRWKDSKFQFRSAGDRRRATPPRKPWQIALESPGRGLISTQTLDMGEL